MWELLLLFVLLVVLIHDHPVFKGDWLTGGVQIFFIEGCSRHTKQSNFKFGFLYQLL